MHLAPPPLSHSLKRGRSSKTWGGCLLGLVGLSPHQAAAPHPSSLRPSPPCPRPPHPRPLHPRPPRPRPPRPRRFRGQKPRDDVFAHTSTNVDMRGSIASEYARAMCLRFSTHGVSKQSPARCPGGRRRQGWGSKILVEIGPDYTEGNKLLEPRGCPGGVHTFAENQCPFPLHNVLPQPPPDYEPFNFPLVHTICLVTAYFESVERYTRIALHRTDSPTTTRATSAPDDLHPS
ncbi:hypothetical protein B0H14DRAFT_3462675 [Mycena olivaceomarginata]|nr:hypothetical protein B0H14DRAFT_3462675 [Mycena olivaceomarginata]